MRFFVVVLVMSISSAFQIRDRAYWKAKPPTLIQHMPSPVPYVIIHHSYIPDECNTTNECIGAMQEMQRMHQEGNGWNDIGYSFGVGGDGDAYEGRGWDKVGAHAPTYNNKSIGICIIGDWTKNVPPMKQLQTVHDLIEYGVSNGLIRDDYTLYGHQQVREGTECPGDALFKEITQWKHFSWDVDHIYHPPTINFLE